MRSARPFPSVLVTGTDTHVGKTWFSSHLVRWLTEQGYSCGAYKPACSGAEFRDDGSPYWRDVDQLYLAAAGRFPKELIAPQRFLAPLAPPVAARAQGCVVDAGLIGDGIDRWAGLIDVLVVEGAGGLLCPLSDDLSIADFAAVQSLPMIVVVRAGLGTINHTLMTLEIAERRGLNVLGFVVNQLPGECPQLMCSNAAEIVKRTAIPLLGCMTTGSNRIDDLSGQARQVDWMSLITGVPSTTETRRPDSQPELK